MKTFEYEGFDQANKKHKGTIQASTGEDAILIILQSGIQPTVLQELSSNQIMSLEKLSNLKQFREKLVGHSSKLEEPKFKNTSNLKPSFLKFLLTALLIGGFIFAIIRFIARI